MEFAGNRLHAKDQQKEVEAIERPAQESRQKDMALRAGELLKLLLDGHRREHSRSARRSEPQFPTPGRLPTLDRRRGYLFEQGPDGKEALRENRKYLLQQLSTVWHLIKRRNPSMNGHRGPSP
jgi:hypothetical protein